MKFGKKDQRGRFLRQGHARGERLHLRFAAHGSEVVNHCMLAILQMGASRSLAAREITASPHSATSLGGGP